MQMDIIKKTCDSPCPPEIKQEMEDSFDEKPIYSECTSTSINIGAESLFIDCNSQIFALPTIIPSNIKSSLPSRKSTAKELKVARFQYYRERLKEKNRELKLLNDKFREQQKRRMEQRSRHYQEMQNLLKRI